MSALAFPVRNDGIHPESNEENGDVCQRQDNGNNKRLPFADKMVKIRMQHPAHVYVALIRSDRA